MIIVKEASLEDAVKVNDTVSEFTEYDLKKEYEERCNNVDNLILIACLGDTPIGYIISYDRFKDNSFYCWMAGVNPEFRRQGVLKSLMKYQEEWAKRKGYNKIRIKTRNNRKEMRLYLAKKRF